MALLALTASGFLLLLAAALHDVAARTVPNQLCAAIAALGLTAQAIQGNLLTALPAALAVFIGAALCWRRGWMGGGDVKLLGATALLLPPIMIPSMIAATALAGGLLAIPYLAARGRLPRPAVLYGSAARPRMSIRLFRAECWRLRRGGPMPYAVAIAIGAVFVLAHGTLT